MRLWAPNWENHFFIDLAVMWKQERTTHKLLKKDRSLCPWCPHTIGHIWFSDRLPNFCFQMCFDMFALFSQSSVTLPSTTSVTLRYLIATRPSHSAILQSRLPHTTPQSNRDVPRCCSASPQTCTVARPCWTSTTARPLTPAGHPAST